MESTTLFHDNQSAVIIVHNPFCHEQTKTPSCNKLDIFKPLANESLILVRSSIIRRATSCFSISRMKHSIIW